MKSRDEQPKQKENQMLKVSEAQFDQFLANNGLDYEVATMAVPDLFTGEPSRFYATYRKDTNYTFEMGLSDGFTPIQNRDALGIIKDMSGVTELELVRGGTWGGGAGLFAQISLGDFSVGGGADKIGKYLSVVNSHDGSRALNILITPYRFFCKNQVTAAINDAKKTQDRFITVRHTASAERRMEELIRTVHIADNAFVRTQEVYNKMAQTKINEEYVKEVVNKLFPSKPDMGKRGKTIWENTMTAVSARYFDADAGRTEVHTAWNLYNAVQGTIQHDSKNTSTKERSVLMGSIADRSAEALACVLSTCSSEHIPQSVLSEIDTLTA
jgi:phage/plasmid-like protein (TIGR03299 family)